MKIRNEARNLDRYGEMRCMRDIALDFYYLVIRMWDGLILRRERIDLLSQLDADARAEITKLNYSIEGAIAIILKNSDNLLFFLNLPTYLNKHRYLHYSIQQLLHIYPPNVAALDFLVKNFPTGNIAILDYACGIGTFIIFARYFGFSEVIGYDDNSQISEAVTSSFCKEFNLKIFTNLDDISNRKFDVMVCLGLPWQSITNMGELVEKLQISCVLLDSHSSPPRELPGLVKVCEHTRLLSVYESKIWS